VSTWNNLSTSIAKLQKGAGADYIISKGFSTPQATFKPITITKGTVTIDGGGHAILDGRGTSQLFYIGGGTLIVKGVTLQNGHDGDGHNYGAGAVYVDSGSATFSSCSFVGNTATDCDEDGGGAVYVDSGSATFSSCSFVSNTGDDDEDGGAVFVNDGLATFSSCSFVNNTAGDGGGAVSVYSGSARFVNCSFEADGMDPDECNDNGIFIYNDDGNVTFGCPTGTTGADVMPGDELSTSELPPAEQIVSCH
jgi:predicted outer membrane repeat protein